ncbi:MAG: fused MFS/spermidine synthase [Pseudomonadota bacterium]
MKERHVPLLLALYGLSGAVGLAWQVVWVRAFTPLFGAGIESTAAVTATFMAGLGLGGALAPRLLGRGRGLRLYAALELGVGLWGMALPWVLAGLRHLLLPALGGLGEGPAAVLLRLAVAAALVGPPAVALGLTFPAVLQALGAAARPARVGLAYGLNALGAAGGALAAGLWLPWALGLWRGSLLLGGLDLCVAAVAWRLGPGGAVAPPPAAARAPGRVAPSLWALAALTGFAGLALELAWTRLAAPLLVPHLGPGEQAFACVLAAVLAGIGLGSLLGCRHGQRAGGLLAALQAALVMGCVLVLEPVRTALFGPALRPWLEGALPLVPALFLGATFPLLARELLASGEDERGLGRLYAVNTAGAVLGSLLTGFLLIPGLGAQRWLLLLAGLAATTALIGLWRAGWRRTALAALPALAAALSIALPRVPAVAGVRVLTAGEHVIAAQEGRQATAMALEDTRGERILLTGGHRIFEGRCAEVDDHARRALAPASLHPEPRRVLLIGLGTGATAAAMLQVPSLEALSVVELDERQRDLLPHFGHEDLLQDPRFSLLAGDGRQHLRTHPERWDLIVVDAYGPETTPAFYTGDFFHEAGERLAPGGLVFVKLIPSDLPDQATLAAFLCTLFDALPHTALIYLGDGFSGLIGGNEPFRGVDVDRIGARPEGSEALCVSARRVDDDRGLWLRKPAEAHAAGILLDPWWQAQGRRDAPPWRLDAKKRAQQHGAGAPPQPAPRP